MATQEQKTRPIHTCPCGHVKATIWKNVGKNGPFYSVQVSRLFKDSEGNPRNSDAFNVNDLSAVKTALELTQDWIEQHSL